MRCYGRIQEGQYISTKILSLIPHSPPQPALDTHPKLPRCPPGGLPPCLPHPYCPFEGLGRLASPARCGARECSYCTLHLSVLAQFRPRPGHYADWTSVQFYVKPGTIATSEQGKGIPVHLSIPTPYLGTYW
jgi:hypothetical protein